MPFLDWVNKHQARQVAGEVPYRLLDFQAQYPAVGTQFILAAHGDGLFLSGFCRRAAGWAYGCDRIQG